MAPVRGRSPRARGSTIHGRAAHRRQRRQRRRAAHPGRPRRARHPNRDSPGRIGELPRRGACAREALRHAGGRHSRRSVTGVRRRDVRFSSGGRCPRLRRVSHADSRLLVRRDPRVPVVRGGARRLDCSPGGARARAASCMDLSLARLAGALGAPAERADGSARGADDRCRLGARGDADGRARLPMMLLLGDDALAARAAVARNELAPLATSLATELRGLEERELYVPEEKALLSRTGGRCERDGSTLEFDPFSPHRHRCPVCGTVHAGEFHDRFWVFWYQLWLAERAVHGALLGRLRGDANAAALATRILERYTDEYLLYPNRDNVLGPTRVFFSIYLEEICLVNLCIALDLLSPTTGALGELVRDRIIEPSAALIASYDEGASNRQVWNDAALLAAARLLGRENDVVHAVFGRSGVLHHLEHGLLADGTWYEGENYHLFAHRGLWYGLTMAQHAGLAFPPSAVARFQAGFATPFLTALPDMTLPSRRDSPYAISLRQPRFAELCELGLAGEAGDGDPRLRSMLHRLYDDPYPRREIGRANSTADVERNLPGSALSRADLGWRSLLFARPVLPPLAPAPLGSVLLEAQGIAVFRRERERVYIALDYGASGGGHGHPDRLNVLLSDDGTRWLDDMGTGSYVDPSLHWYRSTLAHNAPLFDGYQQQRVDGELLFFEERGDIGWVCARALDLYPGVAAMRTLVVSDDYVLDELAWETKSSTVMDLPIHIDADVDM